MKVLHVISSLSNRFGGPTRVLEGLSKEQVRRGMDVTICTSNVEYPSGVLPVPTNAPVDVGGVKIWYFPVFFRPLLYSFAMRQWLKDSIRTFDAVHIHGIYRFPVAYAAQRARKDGIPYVVRPCGTLDPVVYARSKYSTVLKRAYEVLFAIPNLNAASAIHYTTDDERVRAEFLRLTAYNVVVPNGIDWDAFAVRPARGRFRARLGIGDDTPLVLFLGRITYKKGLDLLIPAFAEVIREMPDVQLAIVGPDDEGLGQTIRAWCRQHNIEDHVRFMDHVPQDQAIEAFVDSDVFALPSYSENFGMTVAEAMACGCPVVISPEVSIWREVQGAGAGRVVDLNVPDIARAILYLLRNPTSARTLGAAGRQLVQNRFIWNKIADEITNVYSSLRRPT